MSIAQQVNAMNRLVFSASPKDRDHRIITGDTPHGVFKIEVRESVDGGAILSPDGRVIGTADLTIKTPPPAKTKTNERARTATGCKSCGSESPPPPESPQEKPPWVRITHRIAHRITPPGTWLSQLIAVVGLGLIQHCPSCSKRANAMDQAGWLGLPKLAGRAVGSRLRRVDRIGTFNGPMGRNQSN